MKKLIRYFFILSLVAGFLASCSYSYVRQSSGTARPHSDTTQTNDVFVNIEATNTSPAVSLPVAVTSVTNEVKPVAVPLDIKIVSGPSNIPLIIVVAVTNTVSAQEKPPSEHSQKLLWGVVTLVALAAVLIFAFKLESYLGRKFYGIIGLKIIELLVAFLIAALFKAGSSPPEGMEWVLGTIIFLILQVLEAIVRAKEEYEEHQKTLAAIAEALKNKEESQTLIYVALSYAGQKLDEDQINKAWQELSWHAQKNYRATNYQIGFYDKDDKDVGNILRLQFAKIRCAPLAFSFPIEKIFIWENDNEQNDKTVSVVGKHREDEDAKMLLRQITQPQIKADDNLVKLRSKLEVEFDAIDFAIFDSKAVIVWELKNRKPVGGRVFVSTEKVKFFENFFKELWKKSGPDIP